MAGTEPTAKGPLTPVAALPVPGPGPEAARAARPAARSHPIVGIGASAGGLEAFETFFRACPASTGMAFVLVPHLDPGHESLLTEILQRSTAMPVLQAQDQMATAPDQVYVIPPNREMALLGGVLQLSAPDLPRGHRMPIDAFLRSLADDQGERAIGIVLSGTATDGTLGLRAIHGVGGVCLVQEPATAKYNGMPLSAIAAGYATHVLPVQDMPALLQTVVRQAPYRLAMAAVVPEKSQLGIKKVLLQLRSSTGHDFSQYKPSTIGRRVQRRMAQHAIEDEAVYARFVQQHPEEAQALFKELLINVTSFFRDPAAFVVLQQVILPPLLAGLPEGATLRVWVAGCATGEEAYSIAIVLRELQDQARARGEPELVLQIYATDLDDDAIAVARAGHYPPGVAQDITPERLRRFFTQDDGGYKVRKDVRDLVVFAVQNVIKDPPFSRLDLLSCRNLMIYLEPELQDRLLATFHHALRPGGVLLLSTSESITGRPEWFAALDRKLKFYQARHADSVSLPEVTGALPRLANLGAAAAEAAAAVRPRASQIADLSNRALLQAYAPASVTTSASGDILYVHGDTGRYLRPAPGPMSNNVIDMVREGLQGPLRAALQRAAQAGPALGAEVSIKTLEGLRRVSFSVARLASTTEGQKLLLVSFQDLEAQPPALAGPAGKAGAGIRAARGQPGATPRKLTAPPTAAELSHVAELEQELVFALQNQQVADEEQQAALEELKSSNEELQSTNEELQSANEELETSKEELQSLNEETITINAELNARIEQFTRVQNDMKNLLDSVGTATLFLDHALAIRRYTPAAARIYRLIASDVGRPLSDMRSNLEGANLQAELQSVLDTLVPIEREVRTADGAWYLARMQPYRTLDNVIEGVVLTFTAVTDFKLASQTAERASAELAATLQAATQLARELAEGIVDTVAEPLLVLDGALRVVSASRSFYAHFQVAPAQTVGRKVYELGDGQWDIAALRELLERILPDNRALDGYVVEHDFPGIGRRRMVLNARRIVTTLGGTELILLAMVAIDEGPAP